MRHLIIKLAWVLVVAVDAWRWLSGLVDFGAHAGSGVVERLRSPLILCASGVLVTSSMLSHDDTLAHSTRYRSAGLASSVMRCLDHAFVERLEISAHQTTCWLSVVRRGCGLDI